MDGIQGGSNGATTMTKGALAVGAKTPQEKPPQSGRENMIEKFVWLIPLACLTAVSALLLEPGRIEGVKYTEATKASLTGEYRKMPIATYMGDIEGATYIYQNGSIEIAINNESLLRNWVLRHENCHARQAIENRTREEWGCYLWMLTPN